MYDDRCLVELINQRFDDMNSKVDNLKSDIVIRQDRHELNDQIQHSELSRKMNVIEGSQSKIRWIVAGMSSIAFVVLEASARVIEHYITK